MKRFCILFVCVVCFLLPDSVFAQESSQDLGIAREHYYQGRFYAEQGKFTEAIFELEKAIELNPAYTEAYNALGVIYHRQKNTQQAIKYYLLAVETNPRDAKARTNLAMVYDERQEFLKARQQLEKALEYDPDYVLAQKLLARMKPETEEQEAQEQPQEKPTPPPTSAQTSSSRPSQPATPSKRQTQNAQKARELFEQATLLVKEGRIDAGIRAYQQGLQRVPRSAEGQTLLAMAYRHKFHATGDEAWRQKEISALQRALSFQSKYVPAMLGLGEIYYDQGDIGKAISLFKTVLQQQPDHPAKDQLQAIIDQIP